MGELIKFPGAGTKSVEKDNSPKNKEGENSYLNTKKLVEVLNILTALKKADIRSFGQHTVNRKRDLVGSYSDIELFGWINNYTEDEIKKRPSFYGAIFDELKYRNLC
ncbi:MAG: hypothetical protein UR66_C0009G0060 [Candidatus Moranbacteria bacterium GW2011_GWE1_35_17]|nr:MAG: hypothetical protein UR66_C0009G0060 [Candidatus Moranbacteria bacterium GW2011_GWE1_35_17]KKP83133.1 MAG: hypothetical protein UR82_C0024G0011 [Candidatus Moranbacteria bacterium GW2011_GWF1_35_5]KKP83999.1 MAG: hypothetical protein UR83_C0029G0032 [Candidatus Moranbacteria bacterium GW2011_GWF2_35_54]